MCVCLGLCFGAHAASVGCVFWEVYMVAGLRDNINARRWWVEGVWVREEREGQIECE